MSTRRSTPISHSVAAAQVCGDQFAIFESIVSLAMLMRRFDVELDASKHPDGECGMTRATIHTTNGLHVKLTDAKVGVGRRCAGCTPKESRPE